MKEVLIIEPFCGGSHKQLVDFLVKNFADRLQLSPFTLPAKKWHWRARTSALHFTQAVPHGKTYSALFCSSVLNLAEMCALRPDLAAVPRKVVYFHENQLCYPVRERKDRDFQYGYNQILTALTADDVIFNSEYNMNSFLRHLDDFFRLQPDHRPAKGSLMAKIKPKARVIYFPLVLRHQPPVEHSCDDGGVLRIAWPHRWEHDKNPDSFFECLLRLKSEGFRFRVAVLGESYNEKPPVFEEFRASLDEEDVLHWGFLESKDDYWRVLSTSDVVVSTAVHEFFGVSMLEAASAGCYPLAPNRLVYPEIFPPECLYNTDAQLYKKLRSFCKNPSLVRDCEIRERLRLERFSHDNLKETYFKVLGGAE